MINISLLVCCSYVKKFGVLSWHYNCAVMFFSHEHIEILTVSEECLFFKQRDGPWFPAIRLLHKCAS